MILASQSPRRIELMREAGYDIRVIPADIDETPFDGEAPLTLVERLARAKAAAVTAEHAEPNELTVAADTIVTFDGQILGKPADGDEARTMLRELSGRTHQVATGVCIVKAGDATAPHAAESLHQQLLTMSIGEKEKEIVEKLAGALDSRGYLEIPVKKLAKYIPCSVQELRSALEILKSLEPAGIGATDLKECLILQLRRQKDSRLAVTLVKNYLEDLPKHRISAIAKELGENEDAVKDAISQ